MITIEIKDLGEAIEIVELYEEVGASCAGRSSHTHCRISGSELLDALALWRNTLLEMEDGND